MDISHQTWIQLLTTRTLQISHPYRSACPLNIDNRFNSTIERIYLCFLCYIMSIHNDGTWMISCNHIAIMNLLATSANILIIVRNWQRSDVTCTVAVQRKIYANRLFFFSIFPFCRKMSRPSCVLGRSFWFGINVRTGAPAISIYLTRRSS